MGYETGYNIGLFVGSLIWGLIWGFATAGVRDRKGYGRRWFWFGFFLGFIPFIIACAIPEKQEDYGYYSNYNAMNLLRSQQNDYRYPGNIDGGNWQCACGRVNASYVSTCTCGVNKRQCAVPVEATPAQTALQQRNSELRKYAMMLDSQVISQAEYDAKVKELLNN